MSEKEKASRSPNPPAPNSKPGRGALPFTFLSAIVSLLFIFYGVSLLPPTLFGIGTSVYGVLNLLVLGCAYLYRARWCVTVIQLAAAGYLLLYVLALATGWETGLGISGILVVALGLWCNWFAITKVIRKPA